MLWKKVFTLAVLACSAAAYFGRASAAYLFHRVFLRSLRSCDVWRKGQQSGRQVEKHLGGEGQSKIRLHAVIVHQGNSVRGRTEPLIGAIWRTLFDICQSLVFQLPVVRRRWEYNIIFKRRLEILDRRSFPPHFTRVLEFKHSPTKQRLNSRLWQCWPFRPTCRLDLFPITYLPSINPSVSWLFPFRIKVFP